MGLHEEFNDLRVRYVRLALRQLNFYRPVIFSHKVFLEPVVLRLSCQTEALI